MSTMTIAAAAPAAGRSRARIPFGRILWVELTKMFNTRSGFWLAGEHRDHRRCSRRPP